VLIDTSAVYKYPILAPILASRREAGVISPEVTIELSRNAAGDKLSYLAHPFTLVPDEANAVAIARMRNQYSGKGGAGVEGDIIIGTTAITSGRKLYSGDGFLVAAVIGAGGSAVYVAPNGIPSG
jgi:hypothetical protein